MEMTMHFNGVEIDFDSNPDNGIQYNHPNFELYPDLDQLQSNPTLIDSR